MRVLSYGDFSRDLRRKQTAAGAPSSATIEVTRRCPLECAHCYNNLPMGDVEARRDELSAPELCRLIDDLAETGCLHLLFTGGEVFARKDFLDIYTHAKRRGFLVTIFTNGTLLTPKIADHLVEYRPFSIEITLYGRTKETYERLTGVAGSFDRCLRGIQLLRDRALPLKLKTVAVRINRHEVFEMKRFAEEELGVPFKFDAMMTPRIDCSQSPLSVRLSAREVVEMDVEDAARADAWREYGAAHVRSLPARLDGLVYTCGGGAEAFAVDPAGQMTICTLSHQDAYDARKGSLREGWEQFLRDIRKKRTTRITKCSRCHLKLMCGMCPANAELEAGDPEQPVDFLCHVAHLRAAALQIAVPPHGDCEYCAGGSLHDTLQEELAQIAAGAGVSRHSPELPILRDAPGCQTGGCSSCRGGDAS